MGILYRQEQFATKADFKVLSLGVRTQLDHLDQKVSRFEVRMTADIAVFSEEGPCAVYNLGLGLTPRFQSSRSIRASDWAVSSVVEHCLHTAGVTSSNLVPPTNFPQSSKRVTVLTGHLVTDSMIFTYALG